MPNITAPGGGSSAFGMENYMEPGPAGFGESLKADHAQGASTCADELQSLEGWCEKQRHSIGAVDGFDYRSGEEFGIRRVEIEIRTRREKLASRSPAASDSAYTEEVTDILESEIRKLSARLDAHKREIQEAGAERIRLEALVEELKACLRQFVPEGWVLDCTCDDCKKVNEAARLSLPFSSTVQTSDHLPGCQYDCGECHCFEHTPQVLARDGDHNA